MKAKNLIANEPLTEKWLLKFGFKRIGGSSNWENRTFVLNKFVVHQIPEGGVFYCIPLKCVGIPLEYVHDLQMAYYFFKKEKLQLYL